MSTTTALSTPSIDREREDLLEVLAMHRFLLLRTVDGLDDARAALRPTASQLCLGGIIRHLTRCERQWARFIVNGAGSEVSPEEWMEAFEFGPDHALGTVVGEYREVTAATDRLIREVDDLDADHALPEAPWFEPGKRWSARRVLVHLVGETAQHAGHADIIRETIDGQKTMG